MACKEIYERFSCRYYKTAAEISHETLEQILHAGMMAPASRGQKKWRFYVTENTEKIDRISKTIPNHLWVKKSRVLIMVFMPKEGTTDNDYMGLGACIENMLLESTSMGIASCWIGSCIHYREELKGVFYNKNYNLVAAIALGYSDLKRKEQCTDISSYVFGYDLRMEHDQRSSLKPEEVVINVGK